MSGDRLWVQCCVATTHSHTALRRPPKGNLPSGAEPRGKGQPQNRGKDRPREKVLLLGKGDLHGVVLSDLKALKGIPGCPCLHLVVKLHKGDVMPPRDQADLLEAREPERRK